MSVPVVRDFRTNRNAAQGGAANPGNSNVTDDRNYTANATKCKAERWARVEVSELEAWGEIGGAYGVAVLTVLRAHAGASGAAWPSLDTIAAVSRVSLRQVKRVIAAARDAGLIEVESHRVKGRVGRPTNLYRLPDHVSGLRGPKTTHEESGLVDPKSGVSGLEGEDFGPEGPGVSGLRGPGTVPVTATEEQQPPSHPTEEPPLAPPSAPSGDGTDPDVGSGERTRKKASDVERVWQHYVKLKQEHFRAKNGRTSPPPRLTRESKRLIKNRLKDYPVEDLLAALAGMFANPHNLGENERAKEYLDIGIALRINQNCNNVERFRDEHLAKVAEGSGAAEERTDLAGRPLSDKRCRLHHGTRHQTPSGRVYYVDSIAREREIARVGEDALRPKPGSRPPFHLDHPPRDFCPECQDAYKGEPHDCQPPRMRTPPADEEADQYLPIMEQPGSGVSGPPPGKGRYRRLNGETGRDWGDWGAPN